MTATTTDRYPTSLQCWPGGKIIYYSGDPHGDDLRIHAGYEDREGRTASLEDERTIKVQLRALRYLDHEILCLDNLVGDLLTASGSGELTGELARAFAWEEVENLRPDPSDWDLEECRDYLSDNGYDGDLPDPNPWAMTRDELAGALEADPPDGFTTLTTASLFLHVVDGINDGGIDGLDDWRDAVREVIDSSNDAEVYQWYRVTKYLCEELRAIGEVVLDNGHGMWWGRQCCGQSIIMDGVFQRISERHLDQR